MQKFLTLTSRLLKKIERSSYGFLVIFIRITEEYLCKRAWRALPSMKASVNRSQLTLPLCKVGVHSAASNDQSRLTSGLIDFFIL
uniref:Uncharacterized protein n=1 Tax=Escherichia coli O1:H7 TaxID=2079151 RepID=A0A7G8AEJ8_ECOLX|nr:hypothetical protein [Escherichia coli O1:H7]